MTSGTPKGLSIKSMSLICILWEEWSQSDGSSSLAILAWWSLQLYIEADISSVLRESLVFARYRCTDCQHVMIQLGYLWTAFDDTSTANFPTGTSKGCISCRPVDSFHGIQSENWLEDLASSRSSGIGQCTSVFFRRSTPRKYLPLMLYYCLCRPQIISQTYFMVQTCWSKKKP